MPDLTQMQVKVGVHESVVERITPGLTARVILPDQTLHGEVTTVASITAPAGWWTGNQVRYDTIVELPSIDRLRPGMSAEVEILIASYKDVLKIPVAAVVENDEQGYCWVMTDEGAGRRTVTLGDSNGVFTIVESGLAEGDEVILNIAPFITGLPTTDDKESKDNVVTPVKTTNADQKLKNEKPKE